MEKFLIGIGIFWLVAITNYNICIYYLGDGWDTVICAIIITLLYDIMVHKPMFGVDFD